MQFLYPQYFYLLFLLLIPLIVHLFNLQRTKRVEFTNLSLIAEIKKTTSNRFQLKRWLVLLTRMSALALLVLAFCYPYLPVDQGGDGLKGKILSIDNSMSMSRESDGVRMFQKAQSFLNQIIETSVSSQKFKVFSHSHLGAGSFVSKEMARENLEEITVQEGSYSLTSVFSSVSFGEEELESIYISDFQKNTLASVSDLDVDSIQRVTLIKLEGGGTRNAFVDSLWTETRYLSVDEEVKLFCLVVNGGDETVAEVDLRVIINGNQLSSATVSLEKGEKKVVPLTFFLNEDGLIDGQITLEGDDVLFDNTFYFALNVGQKIGVCVISDDRDSTTQGMKALGNEDRFDVFRMTSGNIDYEILQNVDLIIVEELNDENLGLVEQVYSNPSVVANWLIFPGSGLSQIPIFVGRKDYSIIETDTSNPREAMKIGKVELEFLSNVFENNSQNVSMPWMIRVLDLNGGTSILGSNTGNTLMTRIQGKSDVYLSGFCLDPQYSNITAHSLFVPILYKIAFASASGVGDLYYKYRGSLVQLRSGQLSSDQRVSLEDNNKKYIPQQRVSNGVVSMEMDPAVLEPGVFEVCIGDSVLGKIAINRNSDESIMDFLSFEELQEMFQDSPNIRVESVNLDEWSGGDSQAQTNDVSLWKWFVLGCLFFLLTEVVLIRFLS